MILYICIYSSLSIYLSLYIYIYIHTLLPYADAQVYKFFGRDRPVSEVRTGDKSLRPSSAM